MIWNEKKVNKIDLLKYQKRLGISRPMAAILLSLGIDFSTAEKLLNDPTDLFDVESEICGENEVVSYLKTLREDTVIDIFADYDVDGLTSGFILNDYFRIMGYESNVYYPERSQGYGINKKWCEKIVAADGKHLVICVDNGITAIGPIQYLRDNGIDVLVVDHHEPGAVIPNANAVCDAWIDEGYGTHLCAAAVAWKVIISLSIAKEMPHDTINAIVMGYLPFVALATVADVMPPCDENRAIVQAGLREMDEGTSTVIKALMNVENIEHMRTKDLAWTISPDLNSCSRMDNMALAERFISMEGSEDEEDTLATARAVRDVNRKRKELTAKLCEEIESAHDFSKDVVCFADCSKAPLGLIGIIAGKISESTGKPAVAYQKKDGVGYGSARAPQGMSVKDLVNYEAGKDNAIAAMGHAEACGVQILPDKIEEFNRDLIESGIVEVTDEEETEPVIELDVVITPDDMNYQTRREINSFGYTQKDIPTIGILGAEVEAIPWETSSGKRHVLFAMKDSNDKVKYAVMWNGLDVYENMGSPKKINLAGTLDNGTFCRYCRGAHIGENSTILTVDYMEGVSA